MATKKIVKLNKTNDLNVFPRFQTECFFNTDLIFELGAEHVFQEMPEISAYGRLCDTLASVCEKKM